MYIQIAGIVERNTHNDEKKELFFISSDIRIYPKGFVANTTNTDRIMDIYGKVNIS